MEDSETSEGVSKQNAELGPTFPEGIERFDKDLSLQLHAKGSWVPRGILRALEYSADGLLVIPLTAALWMAPILLDKPELRSFLFNLFVAFLVDLAVIGVTKGLVRRPRPVYNKGKHMVVSVDHYSFPSGHSSRTVMIAVLVCLYLPLWRSLLASYRSPLEGSFMDEYLPALEICVALAAVCWALATANSRILLGRHYVLDVCAGILVGVFEALLVHYVLFVPHHVSQSMHDSLLGVFKEKGF